MDHRVRFPYRLLNGVPMPLVPVGLPGASAVTIALVDSGAAVSVFRAEIAERLGLHLKEGAPRPLQGAGSKITAYEHRVLLRIAGHEFESTVAFSDELQISANLLGHAEFFLHFEVTLRTDQRWFDLTWLGE